MDIEQITHETYNKVERLDHDVREALENSNAGGVDVSGLKTSINSKIESSKSSIKGTDDIDLTSVKDQIDTVKTEIVNAVNDIDLSAVDTKIDSAKSEISQAIENIDLSTVNTKIDSVKSDIVGSDNMNLTGIYNKISTCHTVVAGDGSVSLPNLNEKLIGLQLGQTVMQNDIDADSAKLDNLASSVQTINSNVVTINSNTATTSTSIETIKQDIEVLKKKMSTLVNEDTNYSGKSFSDYPAGTIIKTYDVDERILNMTHTSGLTLPKIYFCSEAGSAGQIKVHIEFKILNNACDALISTYLNGSQICQETFEVENTDTTYIYEKTFSQNFNETEKGNNIYVKFALESSVSGKSIVVTKQKIEILSPNADIINKLCNFDVVCLADGKYHIADCTSGIAKIAEIEPQNMNNATVLDFESTNIETYDYRFASNYKEYSGTYLYDKLGFRYISKVNKVYYDIGNTNLKNMDANNFYMDWLDGIDERNNFIVCDITNNCIKYLYYNGASNDSATTSNIKNRNFIKCSGVRFLHGKYTTQTGIAKSFVTIDKNGKVNFFKSIHEVVDSIDLGYGSDATICLSEFNSFADYKYDIYIKHFDKIIKKTISYINYSPQLTSTIEIGAYEKFFEMPNNDYFVIKNNELKYYKQIED